MKGTIFNDAQMFSLLRCPVCRSGALTVINIELVCCDCASTWPMAGQRPILLRYDNDLFSVDDYIKAVPNMKAGTNGWERFVPSPSVNLANDRVLTNCARY